MSAICAENIALKRGKKYILQDICWRIEEGEHWLLFGLNGCGKTTLLSILSGYIESSGGTLALFDEMIGDDNILALRRQIGWVSASFFEQYLKTEAILDIVLSGKSATLGIREGLSDEDVRQAKRVLTALGLKKQMRYPYDLLSRGQKQRVLLARALMSEKRLLILDEPCAGLDLLSKQKILQNLQDFCQIPQKTIIYVTHHTDEILPCFDKALLLKEGKIHSQGAIGDILSSANLSDYFKIPTSVQQSQEGWSIKMDMTNYHIDGTPKAEGGEKHD